MKEKILIIEDEPDIREIIKFELNQNRFNVFTSSNGERGLKIAKSEIPDLIILDLMLPGIQGIDVCKKLKKNKKTKNILIIIISALGQEEDIVNGLETGADDYLTKPFSLKILMSKISAVLRRKKFLNQSTNNDIYIHNILISPKKREVTINNKLVELTFSEFQILKLLASHPGWVFTRYQIIEKIREDNYPVTDRSVDFQISGIRKKLKAKSSVIQTIRGVGYRFISDEK
tara:strand:- start:218 stop:910 length:693 start_codon:yes stop_codon:yes gene_type:complete